MARESAARGRRPEERVATRFPSVAQTVAASVLRLPRDSRLRQAWLARVARIGFEAWVRGDYEVLRATAAPDIEVHFEQGATVGSKVPVGLDELYRGPDRYCESMAAWADAFKNFRAEVDQVVDEAPDRFLIIARQTGEGIASGMSIEVWGAMRYTLRGGRITRADVFFAPSRDAALAMADAPTPAR